MLPIYKKRELHSLPHLNDDKFKGYSNERIRETIEHNAREFFDVSLEKVRSKSRKREHVFPRQRRQYMK
jgi:chromosomal replication initiation ATPase DnaA